MSVAATAFHARTAEHNSDNAWLEKNGYTVAAHFGNALDEAMAARLSVAMSDISWRSRTTFSGARAADCLSRLTTRFASALEAGRAHKALWLNDAGAVRGAGAVVRLGTDSFQIVSAADDRDWFVRAASLFDVAILQAEEEEAEIALIGPNAAKLLVAAELPGDVAPLECRRAAWRGIDVALSRLGEHGGVEIWCRADDALIVWDRLVAAGKAFALQIAGADAMDTLDLEAGVARPWRDFIPARDVASDAPSPRALALESLIDPTHMGFNGRRAWQFKRHSPPSRTLAGIVLDGELPASFAVLTKDERAVGRTLSSRYSPSLRRAIALAEIETALAKTGTNLVVAAPLSLAQGEAVRVAARVVDLPFLPSPDSIVA